MTQRIDPAGPPARILIADDERHNRQLLEVMLAPLGYQVVSAASGREALALVAQQRPDLILLDVMMPDMDGYQVAAAIKAGPATRNIPIIMITALDDRDARMLGLNAGAEEFLSKPIDRAELSVRVRNLLRLKSYADQHENYSQRLEREVQARTADLTERIVALERQAALAATRSSAPSSGTEAGGLDDAESRRYIDVMTTIGLIGAGHIGSQLARLATAHRYHVVISNSRGPETLAALVAELGPNARAATVVDAATAGDIVVVTIPLKSYAQVPAGPLAGKIVIDTNNYYPQRDGRIPELDDESTTSAELLQAHLPAAKVVKAFNHIYASALTLEGQPAGSANRRALAIAGDDDAAKATVAGLIDQFGFDTVDAGPLAEGWRIQPDTPGYGPRRTAAELRADLAAAKRRNDR